MRIVFMGSPRFAIPALDALNNAGHEIAAVYTQPPRPAGRGQIKRVSPVHARASSLGFPVLCPRSFADSTTQAEFAAFEADVAVVVAYGLILPEAVLDAPARGCLNIHPSLLPRWRGAAPVQRAIMAGDRQTGLCIMRMDAGLDTGPILIRETTPIGAEETAGELHDRLARKGACLIIRALTHLDDLATEPQGNEGVTYAGKISKKEARIDWRCPAGELEHQIRGLSPMPGAWTEFADTRIKLLASCAVSGTGEPGEVLDDKLTVACGEGAVQVLRLQRSGGSVQETEAFLRGFAISKGDCLG